MTKIDVNYLKNHLSHFSEELKFLNSFDEVKVAGRITNVFVPISNEMHILEVDDFVGKFTIILFDTVFEKYKKILKEGNYISFDGILYMFEENKKNNPKKRNLVYAYDLKKIKED